MDLKSYFLAQRCRTIGCPAVVMLPETIYLHEAGRETVIGEGDRVQNELDALCRDAGWVESLGDWGCKACCDRQRLLEAEDIVLLPEEYWAKQRLLEDIRRRA